MLYKSTFFPIVANGTLLPILDITILKDICQFDRQKLAYHITVIFKYLNTSEMLHVFFFFFFFFAFYI